ncbi:MAG: glycosyltransferase [Candidatus Kaelpia imicola]|nr:glycosyltransferase [Candidatus Kaelpia imicola]
MSPRRILILYTTNKSGHHHAALALQEAIAELDSNIEVNCVDAFSYTNPVLNKITHTTYMQIIRRRPEVWGYLYDNPDIVRRSQNLKKMIHKYSSRKLVNLFSELNPDIVVCTQAFPCGMVADLKKYKKIDIPIVGVTTDYVTHSFWYYESVDSYIVSDESTKVQMVKNGIKEERVRVYGIPISPQFIKPVDRDEVFKDLDLEPGLPVVVVMGGGRGLGRIKQVVYSLSKAPKRFQIVAICGVNKKLHFYLRVKSRWLNKIKPFKVFGYIENMHRIMSVADILISKPGGITTAEALAEGLPMIIFNPIPGQEISNTEFLLKSGAAIRCDRITDIGILVEELLQEGNKLSVMSDSARQAGSPDSSLKISREILNLIGYV